MPLHAWSHSYSDLVQAAGALRAAGGVPLHDRTPRPLAVSHPRPTVVAGIDIVLPSELLQRVNDNVFAGTTCACETPGAGKAGHNGYMCSDGAKSYCAASEECFATLRFAKGDWASGCGNLKP